MAGVAKAPTADLAFEAPIKQVGIWLQGLVLQNRCQETWKVAKIAYYDSISSSCIADDGILPRAFVVAAFERYVIKISKAHE